MPFTNWNRMGKVALPILWCLSNANKKSHYHKKKIIRQSIWQPCMRNKIEWMRKFNLICVFYKQSSKKLVADLPPWIYYTCWQIDCSGCCWKMFKVSVINYPNLEMFETAADNMVEKRFNKMTAYFRS